MSAGPVKLSVGRVYGTFWSLATLPRNVLILSIPILALQNDHRAQDMALFRGEEYDISYCYFYPSQECRVMAGLAALGLFVQMQVGQNPNPGGGAALAGMFFFLM